jgi:VWFA-related protein
VADRAAALTRVLPVDARHPGGRQWNMPRPSLAHAALAAALFAVPQQPPPQQPTFRAGVDIVTVDVSVSRSEEYVEGLQARNFDVLDNGVRQNIDKVTFEQVPIDAYLVFDISGSIAGDKLAELRHAADAFVDGLTPRDQVSLVTFAKEMKIQQALTGDFALFRLALDDIKPGGQTALFDATAQTIRLRERNDRRAVVLILTDQGDNASEVTQKQAIEIAERSDVIVYGVLADDASTGRMPGGGMMAPGGGGFRPPQLQFQLGFLRSLADATGGRVFRANPRLPLAEVFGLVLDDAPTRYVITYVPDKTTPGWHKLQVKLVDVKGDVVARRGYYVANGASGREQ